MSHKANTSPQGPYRKFAEEYRISRVHAEMGWNYTLQAFIINDMGYVRSAGCTPNLLL